MFLFHTIPLGECLIFESLGLLNAGIIFSYFNLPFIVQTLGFSKVDTFISKLISSLIWLQNCSINNHLLPLLYISINYLSPGQLHFFCQIQFGHLT
jgi:hypothetical protein